MIKTKKQYIYILVCSTILVLVFTLSARNTGIKNPFPEETSIPVLAVSLTLPQQMLLQISTPVSGHITAWQEASIGAEIDGLRIRQVNNNVGDIVSRGQVLALLNADIVAAELAEATAAVSQAVAEALEADANSKRAQELNKTGAMSTQQLNQYSAAAAIARARLEAMQAAEKKYQLRLSQTYVIAPADGVITSRTATVGAVIASGDELFRLIEDGRLEWRAVVAQSELNKLAPGQAAKIFVQHHQNVDGIVRTIAPTIDTGTHNGLIYVDLPKAYQIRAGTFARGYIETGEKLALTLPPQAVVLRDGFHYVMQVDDHSVVTMKKVSVGQAAGTQIEITAGLTSSDTVIASGLQFLSEGDKVRVIGREASHHSGVSPLSSHSNLVAE